MTDAILDALDMQERYEKCERKAKEMGILRSNNEIWQKIPAHRGKKDLEAELADAKDCGGIASDIAEMFNSSNKKETKMDDNITAERANEMITWPGEALDEIERYRVELESVKAERDAMRDKAKEIMRYRCTGSQDAVNAARWILDAGKAAREAAKEGQK